MKHIKSKNGKQYSFEYYPKDKYHEKSKYRISILCEQKLMGLPLWNEIFQGTKGQCLKFFEKLDIKNAEKYLIIHKPLD